MKNNLSILIENYRQEVDYLESEMRKCSEEMDYAFAEAYRKNLVYSKEKLQILETLEDPNLEPIEDLEYKIKYLEEWMEKEPSILMYSPDLQRELEEDRKELNRLQQLGKSTYLDSDELLVCLGKFLKQEIENFVMELDEIRLELSQRDQQLSIRIRQVKPGKSRFSYLMTRNGKSKLRQLGFVIGGKEASAYLEKPERLKALELLELLSAIIFEGFHHHYRGEKALIKYTEL